MTELVSLLFVATIPIACKITNFSLHLFVISLHWLIDNYYRDGFSSMVVKIA